MSGALRIHSEIETARPLRAVDGLVNVVGWCLAEEMNDAPEVRLVALLVSDEIEGVEVDASLASSIQSGGLGQTVLPMTRRIERVDVPELFPGHPAAGRCGFVIEGSLPAGVYLANFEARCPDGGWQVFKSLSLAVEGVPFRGAVEVPQSRGTINTRVHVEGWALHPVHEVKELSLRYGHQSLPCTLGRPREDIAAVQHGATHAGRSGFRSKTILSAGHGALRLKARLADGSVAVARTALSVDIRTDENYGLELDLRSSRVSLPGYGHRHSEPTEQAAEPLNILFVLHGDFTSNSALQVCALANELAKSGHDCVVAVPRDRETVSRQASPRFRACLHKDAVVHGGEFANGRGPDVIHSWTTREFVRIATLEIQRRHGGRVVIQLEDNEQELLAQTTGRSWPELERLTAVELDQLVPPELSHPIRSREFLAAADGVTVIVDRLRDFVPAGKPCVTVWPAADARYFFPRPPAPDFRQLIDATSGTMVIFYHGNVHAANAAEMRELYGAVVQLNDDGCRTTLLRAGVDRVAFLGALAPRTRPHVIELGQILTHRHLPPLMALADVFVQPGNPDAFNDFRFPSKLPEFFAIGRPVILPRTNLGEHVRHGIDAYVLERADAPSIAAAVQELRRDRVLHDRLSRGAVAFAETHFSWARSAAVLAKLYGALTRS